MFGIFKSKQDPEVTMETENTAQTRAEEREKQRMVHIDNRENDSKTLISPFKLNEYRWKLNGSGWITETRTFYILSEEGELVMFQIAYSSAGWPVPESCQLTAKYFDPRKACIPVELICDNNKRDQFHHRRSTSLRESSRQEIETNQDGSRSLATDGKTKVNIINYSANDGWITCPPYKGRRRSVFRSSHGREGEEEGNVSECINQAGNKLKADGEKTSVRVNECAAMINSSEGINIQYKGSILQLGLQFNQLCEGFAFGSGKISFGIDGTDGDIEMRFIPAGKVTGNICIDGRNKQFSGIGLNLHQFQGIRPNLVASRWDLCYFVSDLDGKGERTTFFIIQISTAPVYGSESVAYSAIYGEGRLLALSRHGGIRSFNPKLDHVSGYYIPSELRMEWSGQTMDGQSFEASCCVHPHILCERMNLLDQLPFVVRKVAETFIDKPYIYQWVDRTTFHMSMNGKEAAIDGWIYTELSILGAD